VDQVKKIIGTHVLTVHEHMAGPSTWIVLTNPQPYVYIDNCYHGNAVSRDPFVWFTVKPKPVSMNGSRC